MRPGSKTWQHLGWNLTSTWEVIEHNRAARTPRTAGIPQYHPPATSNKKWS